MEDIPAAIQNLFQAEKDKLKAKVEHNFEVAEQYRKDFEAAMVQRDAALLQIDELQKERKRVHESQAKYAKITDELKAELWDKVKTMRSALEFVVGQELTYVECAQGEEIVRRCKEALALKPKDECVQAPVGRALRYCSEYQKTSRDHAPSCGFVEKRKGEEHGA